MTPHVRQLRVVLNTDDLPAALAFYRDALGLAEREAFSGPDDARVVILDAGRATLELANPAQSAFIADVETGGTPSTPVRLAFEVADTPTVTVALTDASAPLLAAPVRTPWESLNARVTDPEGLHVTVFQELAGSPPADLVGTEVAGLGEEALLARAVQMAQANAASGAEPFGAIAVHDGVVVGVGVNTRDVAVDPTAHAEVEAIRDAARRLGRSDLTGVTVYSSCEPCPVCRTVAAVARVEEVVYAADAALVPAAVSDLPADLCRAVAQYRPEMVRPGLTGLTREQLAAPFTTFLERGASG
ncbi:deaminase [Actinotalea ferrariae]|uniref:deaminase n=1 Tax=Actinotalea ferrariae TaxID=1386098 RepID=UPI0009DCDEE8|nr:deaminase [Actinotalea ferrariae]